MAQRDPRRRGREWERLSRGIKVRRQPAGLAYELAKLHAWQPMLPASGAFSGLTAARVHGLWLPPLPLGLPVFASVGTVRGEYLPVRDELQISQHRSTPDRIQIDGLPITSVPETLLECARWLGLIDVVAAVDSALRAGLIDEPAARAIARRRRGAPMLRRALDHADSRSESPWETWLRLLHVFGGVDVTPQVNLYNARGRHIARADLLIDGTRTLHEYDGSHHREPGAHRKDLLRDRDLLEAHYVRRGFVATDVVSGWVRILEEAYASKGMVMPSSALRAWPTLLAESCLTLEGREALLKRVRLVTTQLRVA